MFVLPLLLIALQAAPVLHEDLAALEARVIATAGADIGEAGGPAHGLDRRLRLHRCPVAAEVTRTPTGLAAACPAWGWRVHIALLGNSSGNASNDGVGAGPAIRRGDAVLVRIRGRGFSAWLRAVALENGAIGARIRLRPNSTPASSIMAIVTGPGEAIPAT